MLHVIPIVGIGGQGKTTLAQLIYNDPQVEKYFELRLWVCVSEVFDIKLITEKILKSATNAETPNVEMEQLQGQLRREVADKTYLLVLDDVWNENREEWLKLRALLKIGRKGSKILVTTRSREVAKIMATVSVCELQGLSEEKSWNLFQKMAFEPGQTQQKLHLMEVGKEIVKKCANVPLAIRTVGSLLYGKDDSKWLSFKNRSLANLSDSENGVIDILKLSYQHLQSPLKNCFAYCSLFPKDYEFDKEILINLWMAEGFIVPKNHEGQSLEELAECYFLILMQRCFFQDIKRDEWGNISSCKMHDLMHDLAQQVAGINCKVIAKFEESSSNKGIHHLSFAYRLTSVWKTPSWMLNLKRLRTFLLPEQMRDGSPFSKMICQEILSTFGCLRVLDLHNLGVRNLPSSIGNLIHLRYLNLSQTPIKELPDSITDLLNLQTLNLYHCRLLEILPRNMRKLNNLRSLDTGRCRMLDHMPSGLGELTSLYQLPRFIVNHSPKFRNFPNSSKLSDLKNLNNLKGELIIQIFGELKSPLLEATEANLEGKHGLTKFHIQSDICSLLITGASLDVSGSNHDEALLEGLKPYSNLKQLEIHFYRGQKLPSWAMMGNLCINLPNLVKIDLLRCNWCQQVPSFGQLPSLKSLSLIYLKSVEYMEMDCSVYDLPSLKEPPSTEIPFFPSLQELTLEGMHNLKGWWKEAIVNNDTQDAANIPMKQQRLLSMSFPNVSKLFIQGCLKLISLPLCPNVEELELVHAFETMSVSKMAAASSSNSSSKLKSLTISNVEDLKCLSRECLHQLSSLDVRSGELVNTEEIGKEVFKSISSSLRSLTFSHCDRLRFFGQGLEHLTAIKSLELTIVNSLIYRQMNSCHGKT
ncbi:putative disease resistance protein RGA3 isoform X1 [Spinacia oleracea]|uniref:Disease resistance protein RGA3 isoform X1 n=1 Tax=Spinacia oleracea TaxID=3562 RepID=A0ABM3QTF6_SPIOL|nr:putative disease resistance protein RGA3 isoform X1 [Spinacia oleracea]XP_056686645.1 putative disease resistance protein RGA3 isoform X1 [Spinacia oleracea]XP_056686646.1 putative disease resistance protein RGA3 isoform X1 [Spinacia oleracea]